MLENFGKYVCLNLFEIEVVKEYYIHYFSGVFLVNSLTNYILIHLSNSVRFCHSVLVRLFLYFKFWWTQWKLFYPAYGSGTQFHSQHDWVTTIWFYILEIIFSKLCHIIVIPKTKRVLKKFQSILMNPVKLFPPSQHDWLTTIWFYWK